MRFALSAATMAAIAQYVEGVTSSFEPGEYPLEPPRDLAIESEAMLVRVTRDEFESAT